MKNPVDIAEAYYTEWGKKNIPGMERYLHPDVTVIGPLSELVGKNAVLEALKQGAMVFKSLSIRAKFGSEDKAMMVFDLNFPEPIGKLRSSSLLNIQNGLISKIELFFDPRPLVKMMENNFTK